MFEPLNEVGLLDVLRDAQRRERSACAQRVLAAGRFCQLRMADAEDATDRAIWCIDNWEAAAAEVGAELSISRGRASSQMHHGLELLERLPHLGVAFAGGDIDYRVIIAILFRTELILEPTLLARIDQQLTTAAPTWNALSRKKITELVDWMVRQLDPDAVRVARDNTTDRHIDIGPSRDGLAEIWGTVHATEAAALDQRLTELAATTCPKDPRTTTQRRADALSALAAGQGAIPCTCNTPDCTSQPTEPSQYVIHLIAETATITGNSDTPALLPGYGAIPADTARQLATHARLRPITSGKELAAEPRYRPSAALAEFIRCRDLTCRFPGCDRPAATADIDHTIPYPHGPTHPSNLKILCRAHHLTKTFYTGPGGWTDRQLPDGTIIWTSPTGRTYTTKPAGTLFFPQLATPTAELTPTTTPATNPGRGLFMPTRKRTRTQQRDTRIHWERGLNQARAAANPPPF